MVCVGLANCAGQERVLTGIPPLFSSDIRCEDFLKQKAASSVVSSVASTDVGCTEQQMTMGLSLYVLIEEAQPQLSLVTYDGGKSGSVCCVLCREPC